MRAVAAAAALIVGVLGASGCAGAGAQKPTIIHPAPGQATPAIVRVWNRGREARVARSSNRLFSIFPAVPAKRRCAIPDDALAAKPIRGMCQTGVRIARTHEPAVIVTFIETWHWPPCPHGSDCLTTQTLHHTWRVVEGEPVVKPGASYRILAIRSSGATAPQEYK